ncbi:MAG: S4 domain-containing protein [Henriciella sp.]
MSETPRDDIRLDVWLWRARFFKTRAAATDYITRKGVRITRYGQTRKTRKASAPMRHGDILTFYRNKAIETIEFLDAGSRRGPASEAQTLYRRLAPEE